VQAWPSSPCFLFCGSCTICVRVLVLFSRGIVSLSSYCTIDHFPCLILLSSHFNRVRDVFYVTLRSINVMLPWGSALVAGLVHDLVFWSDWTLKGLLFMPSVVCCYGLLVFWFMCSLLFMVACLCSLVLESHHIESIQYAGMEFVLQSLNQRCHESLSGT